MCSLWNMLSSFKELYDSIMYSVTYFTTGLTGWTSVFVSSHRTVG